MPIDKAPHLHIRFGEYSLNYYFYDDYMKVIYVEMDPIDLELNLFNCIILKYEAIKYRRA